MRGLKDTRAQHWTISACTTPFTIRKMQHAKSSQFSHRQHYHDYISIAWHPGNSPRNSWYCKKKKMCNKFLHKSCLVSPYTWTLQTGPDTKSSLFRKAIHPFALAHLRDMVHDKKDLFVWGFFLRSLEVMSLCPLICTGCSPSTSGKEASVLSFSKAETRLSWKASQIRASTELPKITSDPSSYGKSLLHASLPSTLFSCSGRKCLTGAHNPA